VTAVLNPGLRVALVGNPNSGKTSLFNLLTGSRQKTANYPGVTVERKEGRFAAGSGIEVTLVDLPGVYSLRPTSPDEAITLNICAGRFAGEARPDVLVCVASALNLRLHLRFVLELRSLGLPIIVALNMMDEARRRGIRVDRAALERELGVPVVETVAVRRYGAAALLARLGELPPVAAAPVAGGDLHAEVRRVLAAAVLLPPRTRTLDDTLDRWVLDPVFGLTILTATMFLMFQAVFAWARPLMAAVQSAIDAIGALLTGAVPAGALRSLLVDGVLAGTGSVLVFVPQILILFLMIFVLEESGYLPRAAYLLDRWMVGAGMTGRSFIPLLSSFACAVPGIMATRTIPDARDRLITIAVAPLMTCSARLPVYTLLIAAFVPRRTILGAFDLQGVVLFVLYAAGVGSALAVAALLKGLRRDRSEHSLMLELPPYRLPRVRSIALGLWERARIFVFERVGKIILACSVVMWFLAHVPGPPPDARLPAIDYSIAGALGHGLAVIFAPLGFSWQICVSLIPGMAAREVVISSLATVYALSATGPEIASKLASIVATQWTLATAFSLLAWYVFSPQCLSTLAVVRRETNSWRTLALVMGYLFALAYGAAFITYRVTLAVTGAGA
jgi:ferrous iron transport protein B